MRSVALMAGALMAGGLLFGVAAHAAPNPAPPVQPHRMAATAEPGKCVAARGLLARAAYVPAAGPSQCARLLSTETILTPRAWNRT